MCHRMHFLDLQQLDHWLTAVCSTDHLTLLHRYWLLSLANCPTELHCAIVNDFCEGLRRVVLTALSIAHFGWLPLPALLVVHFDYLLHSSL